MASASLQSYLILAFMREERVTMDAGFCYTANADGWLIGTVLLGLTYQVGGLALTLGMAAGVVAAPALAAGRLQREHPDETPA
nr:hypothetical protein [Defluviimonas aquaemixtae]